MSIEAPLIGEKLLSNAWPVKVALGEEDATREHRCRRPNWVALIAGCAPLDALFVVTRVSARAWNVVSSRVKGSESRGDRRDVMFDCSGWQKGHRAAIQCLAMDEPFLIGADDGL